MYSHLGYTAKCPEQWCRKVANCKTVLIVSTAKLENRCGSYEIFMGKSWFSRKKKCYAWYQNNIMDDCKSVLICTDVRKISQKWSKFQGIIQGKCYSLVCVRMWYFNLELRKKFSPIWVPRLWKKHAPSSGSVLRRWLRLKAATLNICQVTWIIIKLPELIFSIKVLK